MDVSDRDAYDELSEVAHRREQVASARVGDSGTGTTKITMEDEHGSCDGPAEKNFAVPTDALVCKDTVGTFLDPIDNVLATARPEEAHPNSEECFVDAEVATDGAAVEDAKDKPSQRGRHNDEQERAARLQALANDEAAVMNA
jgi:hypothetical protein